MNIKHLFFTLIISVLVGGSVYFYMSNKTSLKENFPNGVKVDPEAGLNCRAIFGNLLYGNNIGQDKGIHANLFKGSDELAIETDSQGKFSFITKASVGIGQAKSDEGWKVVKNDKEYLIAVLDKLGDPIPIRNSHNTFMLNKENGIAIWTKTRLVNLGTNTPETQSYLLRCN
ncbi:hypothetical protein HY612_02105 [Candidatus Roizmanbacteria bacterium]|nr:hypothetical protein [Candidatus Roizmanbacteria bacterium]